MEKHMSWKEQPKESYRAILVSDNLDFKITVARDKKDFCDEKWSIYQ